MTSRLPSSLDEMVPRFLDALPEDVSWGSRTGAGFGYRVCAEEEWHGLPFLVYALGPDGEDQLGVPGGGERTLWPRSIRSKGIDASTLVFDVPFGMAWDVLDAHLKVLWEEAIKAGFAAEREGRKGNGS